MPDKFDPDEKFRPDEDIDPEEALRRLVNAPKVEPPEDED